MYKNQLQELAQRSCFNLPSYSCIREGPDHAPRFKSTVNFNGETFESPAFCSTLRQAEHAAAEVALNTLAKRGPSRALAAKVLDETGVYKNLLQETAHRAGLNLPVYSTVRAGPGHVPTFSCSAELAGMTFTGEPARTKKQAQKNAAMTAWSALKRLSQCGSSSMSSPSSSSSEIKGNEEQEQVVIALVLASLRPSEAKHHPVQTACQQRQRRSIPLHRDHTPPTPSLYPVCFEHWAYPSFSPELALYQVWQQEQLLQLQNGLLTIPASPAPPSNPHIFPYMQSIFHPEQCLFVPARDQKPVPVATRLTIATSGPSLYFSNHSVQDCVRGRSTVKIQEIHEEKTEESSRFPPSVTPDPIVSGHANAEPRIEEPSEEEDKEKHIELERKVETVQLEGNGTGEFEWASQRSLGFSIRPVDFHSQNQHGSSCSRPPQRPQYPSRPSSDRSLRPSTAATASMMIRTLGPISSIGHRPQSLATCSSALPRMKTGIPSGSARPVSERVNLGGVHSTFMAPPVRIRSVMPVCSAPPQRKMQGSIQEGSIPEREKKKIVKKDASMYEKMKKFTVFYYK